MSISVGVIEEPSISGVWGRITFLTVLVCASVHCLFGFICIWKLFFRDVRALLIPLVYFVVGAAYTFFTTCLLSFAIAVVHFSLSVGVTAAQLTAYVLVLAPLSLFFSSGRTAGSLYAM